MTENKTQTLKLTVNFDKLQREMARVGAPLYEVIKRRHAFSPKPVSEIQIVLEAIMALQFECVTIEVVDDSFLEEKRGDGSHPPEANN